MTDIWLFLFPGLITFEGALRRLLLEMQNVTESLWLPMCMILYLLFA